MTGNQANKTKTTTTYILKMAITRSVTRSMSVPISVKVQKYIKDLDARIRTANAGSTIIQKRTAMIKVFEFLNTNGLRLFGFSGDEGKLIKTLMVKADVWLVELNEEIAAGEVSKRVLNLDKKIVSTLEECKQMVTDHKTGVLLALNSHFPQDIVREIAENYV